MTLPISSIVTVNVTVTPQTPQRPGFGIAACVTSELPTDLIPAPLRVTHFGSITELSDIYPITSEVYKVGNTYFSQSPRPDDFAVIAQYLTPTNAQLFGATSVDDIITNWTAITDGEFTASIASVVVDVLAMDFSTATTMDDVASIMQVAIQAADASVGYTAATVVWDSANKRFIVTSGEAASTMDFMIPVPAGLGTDISAMSKLDLASGGFIIPGSTSESVVDALAAAEQFDSTWYGILLTKANRELQVVEDVAAWTESRTKWFSACTNNPNTLIVGNTDNVAYRLFNTNYQRTSTIFSSTSDQYPDASVLARFFTTDFTAPNSVITGKFKNLPSITGEDITSSQKAGIDEKRCNSFSNVAGVPILQESYMCSQLFMDELQSIDWLVAELEFNTFVYLQTRPTRVPLTDAGGEALRQQVIKTLDSAVLNGMLATGTTSEDVFLPNGYSVAIQKVADQDPADRAARIAPTISFIALLSGAVHFVQINGVLER